MFDALDCSFEKIDIKKNPDCVVCGNSSEIKDLAENLGIYFSPVALYFASKNFYYIVCTNKYYKY